ncbi:MAG: ABC transporter ATP-binding protein [Paracoccaceae bacterium]
MSIILETKDLTKTYSGLVANDNVDFTLNTGQIHALIGPNGAGKSTFVGMVSGRIPVSHGKVWFDGQEVTFKPAHTRIQMGMAYTFQITAIYSNLSVFENVSLALGTRDREECMQALDRVDLRSRATQTAGDLAYGHQRLLEIAMGIAQSPRLLILDEPTQGLAESEIEGFNALIRSIAGETTILLIEHNMNVVMALAQEITVLDRGAVLAHGTPDEIKADQRVQDAYLGTR